MADRAIRQRFLEIVDAYVGDLGVVEPQRLEVGQTLQVHQACVSDLGVAEPKRSELGQPLQVL